MSIKTQVEKAKENLSKIKLLEQFFNSDRMREILKEMDSLNLLSKNAALNIHKKGFYRLFLSDDRVFTLDKLKTIRDYRNNKRFGLFIVTEPFERQEYVDQIIIMISDDYDVTVKMKDKDLKFNETLNALEKIFFDED